MEICTNYFYFTYFVSFSLEIYCSTVAPADPRQFCIPSQFDFALSNANMPNLLSNRVYSGNEKLMSLISGTTVNWTAALSLP